MSPTWRAQGLTVLSIKPLRGVTSGMAQRDPNPHWRQVALGGTTGAAERHAKSRQARLTIITAAGEQFAARGYAAASLSAIASRCGMTKGALYFHFQSKRQLAEAVVVEMLARWTALRVRVGERKLDPLSTLMVEVAEVIDAYSTDPVLRGGVLLARDTDAEETGARAHFDMGLTATMELLGRAAEAGDLRSGVEPAALARQITALLTGHRTLTAAGVSNQTMTEAMDEAWRLLLPAIASAQWLKSVESSSRPTEQAAEGRHEAVAPDAPGFTAAAETFGGLD